MKKTLFITLFSALLSSAIACADDDAKLITKTISVEDFTAIECSIPCEIEYSSGEKSISVTADQKILDNLLTKVKDGKLTISMDKVKIYNFGKMEIRISSENIEKITLNGSVDFESDGGIDTESIEINLNGAAKMELDGLTAYSAAINANGPSSIEIEKIDCDNISVSMNGTGGCELEGHAKKANLTVNGIGGIDIKKFTADELTSAVNGIGKISRN